MAAASDGRWSRCAADHRGRAGEQQQLECAKASSSSSAAEGPSAGWKKLARRYRASQPVHALLPGGPFTPLASVRFPPVSFLSPSVAGFYPVTLTALLSASASADFTTPLINLSSEVHPSIPPHTTNHHNGFFSPHGCAQDGLDRRPELRQGRPPDDEGSAAPEGHPCLLR